MSLSRHTAIVACLAGLSAASPVFLRNAKLVRRQSSAMIAVPSVVAAPSAVPPAVVVSVVPSVAPVVAPSGITSTPPAQPSAVATEPDETSVDWCANADLGSVEGAASVWNDRGVGQFLSDYTSSSGELNWLNNLASATLPGSGDVGAFGCGNRDQSCLSGLPSCADLAAAGHGAEYWIFNAAQKLQDVFERAHENLQDSVIDSSLTVSSIASDFEITFSADSDILSYIAAAFGMASGVIGLGSGPLVEPLTTAAGMLGDIFSTAAISEPEEVDPTQSMDAALKEIFHTQLDILDSTLALAVGGEGDYATLPGQGGDYATSVAKFMADGKFLLQGDMVSDYFSAGYDSLNKKLVDIAMAQYGYSVLADHNYEDAESCAAQYGAFWLDILGGRCMRLVYKQGDNSYYPAPEDVINKVQDTYGMNVHDYYSATCDCAMNGSGEPDLNTLPTDGSAPQCFYNLPCQEAEICLESDDVTWSICWPIDINEVASWSS